MRISDWSSDVCSSDLERCLSGRHTDDKPTGALEKSHLEGLRFNIERAQHSPSHIRRSASCDDRGRTNDEIRSTDGLRDIGSPHRMPPVHCYRRRSCDSEAINTDDTHGTAPAAPPNAATVWRNAPTRHERKRKENGGKTCGETGRA